MKRYYFGVDWADRVHQLYGVDEMGEKVAELKLKESAEELATFGRWLEERRAEEIEIWAAIEKPEGRIIDFLLDHAVVIYPINPKALDRARDRFRQSGSKSDPFDARVLADFVRTDHHRLRALMPNSEQAQELKIMTRDYRRLVRQQTRVSNQLTVTLKEYYPRPLDLFEDLTTKVALDFIKQYPTPEALSKLSHKRWQRFAKEHRLSEARSAELWEKIHKPQVPVTEHVVRAKARLVEVLVEQLKLLVGAVDEYSERVERFFAAMPVAKLTQQLPGGKSGVTLPAVLAEIGDAQGRWQSFRHLQAEAGVVPVTDCSGKSRSVRFRYACNKHMRQAVYWLAFISLRQSEWANAYYQRQRAQGSSHDRALRALGAQWLKIILAVLKHGVPYEENYHLANMARQQLCRAA